MARERSLVQGLAAAAKVAPSLRRGFGLTLLLALAGTAGHVVVPVVIQQVLDREVLGGGPVDLDMVAAATIVSVAVLAGAMVATRAALLRLVRATAHGLAELRVATFRHIHDLSALHVEAERRGALVSRVTSDIEAITHFLEWGGVGMIVGGAQIVLTLAVMLVYDWRLAGLVVVGAAVYALMVGGFQRVLRRLYDRVRVRVSETLAAVSEAVVGLPTIRAFGAEERSLHRVDDALASQFRAEFRVATVGATMFSSAELFAASLTAVVIAAGVLLPGGLSAGQLVAFLFLVTLFIEPVQTMVEVMNEAQSASAGIRRVLEVLETPSDVADPEGGAELPAGPLAITLRQVRFRYPTSTEDVIRPLDLEIAAGTRVAVVGETGSGKSTFAKLLTRLLDPTEGRIELAGVPIDEVRFASLRQRVAFVPQDGFLFDASVADNVRYGRPGAGDGAVRQAFADLGLSAWVDELPEGLATRVGERGGRLSSGERQLLALVRAWIAAPDLLVLDEATSAVDPALEVRLKRAIEHLTSGRTSVTIAHRLSTAETAEEILVFDHGDLVERGPHDALVARDGVYAGLWADWSSHGATAGVSRRSRRPAG